MHIQNKLFIFEKNSRTEKVYIAEQNGGGGFVVHPLCPRLLLEGQVLFKPEATED